MLIYAQLKFIILGLLNDYKLQQQLNTINYTSHTHTTENNKNIHANQDNM
jgi:hypothetical protein